MKWGAAGVGLAIATAVCGGGVPLFAGEHGTHNDHHGHEGMATMETSGDGGIFANAIGHGSQSHAHKQLEISADLPIPSVELLAHPDAMSGWNLELQLENFEFVPHEVNESSSQNEGHAHLYVNGEKVTRLYGNWYYLGDLEPGDHEITVTLNTNRHEDLAVNGEVIAAYTTIAVAE